MSETPIRGAYLTSMGRFEDHRGVFRKIYSSDYHSLGLRGVFDVNYSENSVLGATRGLHYQIYPYGEAKFVQCVSGSVLDFIIDLRRDSPTYGAAFSTVLSAECSNGLVVPLGCAHGYQTLSEGGSGLIYISDQQYMKSHEATISVFEPRVFRLLRLPPTQLSEKDRAGLLFGKHPDPGY